MAAGELIQLVQRVPGDRYEMGWPNDGRLDEKVMVCFRHVCLTKAGEVECIQFSWNGIERGGALNCGCWAAVPMERWERGPERLVYEACRRLGVRA